MKRTLITLAIVVFTSVMAGGCTSAQGSEGFATNTANVKTINGYAASKEISLKAFRKLEVSGIYQVVLHKSGKPRCIISVSRKDDLDKIYPRVQSGILFFKNDIRIPWNFNGKKQNRHCVRLDIYTPYLDGIKMSGAAKLYTQASFEAKSFEIDLSGASALNGLKLDCETLEIDASGAAVMRDSRLEAKWVDLELNGAAVIKESRWNIRGQFLASVSGASQLLLSGRAESLACSVTGAGKVRLADYPVRKCTIDASGAGSAYIHVTDEITEAEASGASNIYYSGGAVVRSIKTSGASHIRQEN